MKFIQAKNYTKGRTSPIKFIVIHDMEYPERLDSAEAVAQWFAGPNAPQASTHYNVDADSIVQSVKDTDTAWCAPGANATGLHFEHAGYARQTKAEWLDSYSTAMLKRSAALVAEKCKQYNIPIRKGDYTDILAGRPCIVGHADVTRAFPDKGTHTDPGTNFPWNIYIQWAQGGSGNEGDLDVDEQTLRGIIRDELKAELTDYQKEAMNTTTSPWSYAKAFPWLMGQIATVRNRQGEHRTENTEGFARLEAKIDAVATASGADPAAVQKMVDEALGNLRIVKSTEETA